MPVSHGGQTKKGTRVKKIIKAISSFAVGKAFHSACCRPLFQASYFVTNHSKHMHGQHMLNKIVHMASLIPKRRGLCRCMLQGDKLAAGQVHCWPLMVGARLTWPGTVSRTRRKDPPPLCLSLLQLTNGSWAVYLSSPNHQWQVQGGKNNLEKNFALIQLSHLHGDKFEQSLGSEG